MLSGSLPSGFEGARFTDSPLGILDTIEIIHAYDEICEKGKVAATRAKPSAKDSQHSGYLFFFSVFLHISHVPSGILSRAVWHSSPVS